MYDQAVWQQLMLNVLLQSVFILLELKTLDVDAIAIFLLHYFS